MKRISSLKEHCHYLFITCELTKRSLIETALVQFFFLSFFLSLIFFSLFYAYSVFCFLSSLYDFISAYSVFNCTYVKCALDGSTYRRSSYSWMCTCTTQKWKKTNMEMFSLWNCMVILRIAQHEHQIYVHFFESEKKSHAMYSIAKYLVLLIKLQKFFFTVPLTLSIRANLDTDNTYEMTMRASFSKCFFLLYIQINTNWSSI